MGKHTPELEALRAALWALGMKPEGTHPADAYYNLAGARIDVAEGRADRVCVSTMERVESQIVEAARILRAAIAKATGEDHAA